MLSQYPQSAFQGFSRGRRGGKQHLLGLWNGLARLKSTRIHATKAFAVADVESSLQPARPNLSVLFLTFGHGEVRV